MTSREEAIKTAMANGIPIHQGYVAEVLDRAAEAHQIHYADQCPGDRGQRNAIALAASRDRARNAYLAGDWDALEAALGIGDLPTDGPTIGVYELARGSRAEEE